MTTAMTRFQIGHRVIATADVRTQWEEAGNTAPMYGHVINIQAQSLIWVRDHEGGEWGLPEWCLEHID